MPRISVIVPAYKSQSTLVAALESLLAQSRPADEILVVDSSPDEYSVEAVRQFGPPVTLIRPGPRLYPHEARNLGARQAQGDLFVFTDPDIVARPNWLARMEETYQATGHIIVGAVDCYGRRWQDVGVHLCKFDSWLPGGPGRTIEIGPSISLCVSRKAFEQAGGFPDDPMLGDTTLSWILSEQGRVLVLEPRAVVAHHHEQGMASLYRERFSRGREFGVIRMKHGHWTTGRVAAWLLISVLPVRLAGLMLRRVRNCARAGWLAWLGLTWPVVLVGEAGWVWGESAAYWTALRARSWARTTKNPV